MRAIKSENSHISYKEKRYTYINIYTYISVYIERCIRKESNSIIEDWDEGLNRVRGA